MQLINKSILVTGATGFIGLPLCQYLQQQGYSITVAVRNATNIIPTTVKQIPIGGLLPNTDWTPALNEVDTIIHLAARTHVMRDVAADPLTEFRNTNTTATLNLAQQAAAAGVRRLIFLSSIKVNGGTTQSGSPFLANASTIPTDPYGLSKYEAEQGLQAMVKQTGMEIVIIRPPLVYGAGVKANFQNMMHWLYKGIPLPLGSIHNQRSLVALPNLINLITTCINHPAAANQIFLVSDGEDLSTTELLKRLSQALNKPAQLLPVPQAWLEAGLILLGKRAIAQRLCNNLQVDISKTRSLLSWAPPVSTDDALRQTAQAYLSQHK